MTERRMAVNIEKRTETKRRVEIKLVIKTGIGKETGTETEIGIEKEIGKKKKESGGLAADLVLKKDETESLGQNHEKGGGVLDPGENVQNPEKEKEDQDQGIEGEEADLNPEKRDTDQDLRIEKEVGAVQGTGREEAVKKGGGVDLELKLQRGKINLYFYLNV